MLVSTYYRHSKTSISIQKPISIRVKLCFLANSQTDPATPQLQTADFFFSSMATDKIVSSKAAGGHTPLHKAAEQGNVLVTLMLLDRMQAELRNRES